MLYGDHIYFGIEPTGGTPHSVAWNLYAFKITQVSDGVDLINMDPNNTTGLVVLEHPTGGSAHWGWQWNHNPMYDPNSSFSTANNTPYFYVQVSNPASIDGSQLTALVHQHGAAYALLSGNIVSSASPSGPWTVRGS